MARAQVGLPGVLFQWVGSEGDRRGGRAGRGDALDQLWPPTVIVVERGEVANIPGQLLPGILVLRSIQRRFCIAQRAVDRFAGQQWAEAKQVAREHLPELCFRWRASFLARLFPRCLVLIAGNDREFGGCDGRWLQARKRLPGKGALLRRRRCVGDIA